MKPMEKIMNGIGLGLLGICFVISLWTVGSRSFREATSDEVHIRFAHWQLESGLRDTIDVLAAEYMKLHPNVRITQMTIPERAYPSWVTTQLAGGMAPDIVELGKGVTAERIARYFEPLGDYIDEVNPYNKGTSLQDVSWRETFLDNMEGGTPGFDILMEYYGVPLSMHTVRFFFNAPLYREIMGDTPYPTTYTELMAFSERTLKWSKETGRNVVPIAGSQYNSPILMERMFASQTQRMSIRQDTTGGLRIGSGRFSTNFLQGELSWKTPELRSALELMQDVCKSMPPGFLQMMREDSTFYFVQERAVATITGSWDSTSLATQSGTELAVVNIPIPVPGPEAFGKFVLGPVSELGLNTSMPFGVPRTSKHKDVAIDFLRFLSSQPINTQFSALSQWLPSVADVPLIPALVPFKPVINGYQQGIIIPTLGADSQRAYSTNFHILADPKRGVDAFVEELDKRLPTAIKSDLDRSIKAAMESCGRRDGVLAAELHLAGITLEQPMPNQGRLAGFFEVQFEQERAAWSNITQLLELEKR